MTRSLLLVSLVACGPKEEPVEAMPEPVVVPVETAPIEEAPPLEPLAAAPVAPTAEEMALQNLATLDAAAALLTTGRENDAQQAVRMLKEVSEADPELALAFYNLGVAYEILGSKLDARKSYLRATDIDSGMGDAWLNMGNMQFREGNLTRALQNYKTGLRGDEENMNLWVAVIATLRQLGQLDRAIEEARAALLVNARSLNVYNNLGLIYMEQGQYDLAKFIYQRALLQEGGDQHAYIRCNLGRVQQLMGFNVDARFAYREALELDPDLVPAMLYLSDDYLENFGDALELLERADGLDPENPNILLNLGIAYRGTERFEDARGAYQRVLRLDPENPEPHLNLGILYGDYLKEYDAAVASYEAYRDAGGIRADEVEGFIDSTLTEKRKVERAAARRERQATERREREEQQRLLEENERREAEEAARRAAEEAANAPVPEPPTEAPPEEGSPGEAPEEAPVEVPEEAPEGEESAPEDVWGTGGGE